MSEDITQLIPYVRDCHYFTELQYYFVGYLRLVKQRLHLYSLADTSQLFTPHQVWSLDVNDSG
ncbi:hypothetical protein E2C01_054656 [Portunus trituberculatus]|uniref:Uncharacterized protein n=1 Tax=Portunus trituberculatus TaxID=210409 RepID=A0A5B7GSM9_PORTR|nr:hypothetical protein [Portunus trituberculatus]